MSTSYPTKPARPAPAPTHGAWRDDFERAAVALEPWVMTAHDATGEPFQYIADNAPPDLARIYGELLSIGYAYGWLR